MAYAIEPSKTAVAFHFVFCVCVFTIHRWLFVAFDTMQTPLIVLIRKCNYKQRAVILYQLHPFAKFCAKCTLIHTPHGASDILCWIKMKTKRKREFGLTADQPVKLKSDERMCPGKWLGWKTTKYRANKRRVGRECEDARMRGCFTLIFYRFHVSLPFAAVAFMWCLLDRTCVYVCAPVYTHEFSFFIDASSLALFIRYWLRVVLLLLSFTDAHTHGCGMFRAKLTKSRQTSEIETGEK